MQTDDSATAEKASNGGACGVAKLYCAGNWHGDRLQQHHPPTLVSQIMLTEVRQTILKVTALSSQMDVILVPGGPGILALMEDGEVLTFLRRQAQGGRYVASVCTGALVLGAAGLLQGYRATTHWTSLEFLSAFGATPCADRIVIDRNRLTGGGVTLALTLRCNSPLSCAAKKRRAGFNSKWNTTRRRPSDPATRTSRMHARFSPLWMQTHSTDRPAVKLSNGSRRDCATPDDR